MTHGLCGNNADNNPHVQKIISMGLVPFFVEALRADDCESLQVRGR